MLQFSFSTTTFSLGSIRASSFARKSGLLRKREKIRTEEMRKKRRPCQVILLFSSFKPPIQSKSTIFFIFAHEVGGLLLPSSQFDLFHWNWTLAENWAVNSWFLLWNLFHHRLSRLRLFQLFARLCCKILPTRFLDQFLLHTHPQHHHCWPPSPLWQMVPPMAYFLKICDCRKQSQLDHIFWNIAKSHY